MDVDRYIIANPCFIVLLDMCDDVPVFAPQRAGLVAGGAGPGLALEVVDTHVTVSEADTHLGTEL